MTAATLGAVTPGGTTSPDDARSVTVTTPAARGLRNASTAAAAVAAGTPTAVTAARRREAASAAAAAASPPAAVAPPATDWSAAEAPGTLFPSQSSMMSRQSSDSGLRGETPTPRRLASRPTAPRHRRRRSSRHGLTGGGRRSLPPRGGGSSGEPAAARRASRPPPTPRRREARRRGPHFDRQRGGTRPGQRGRLATGTSKRVEDGLRTALRGSC